MIQCGHPLSIRHPLATAARALRQPQATAGPHLLPLPRQTRRAVVLAQTRRLQRQIHRLQRLFRLRATIAQLQDLRRQDLRQPRLADGMSAAVSVAEPEAAIRAILTVVAAVAAAALAMILTVGPLGFLAASASDWLERFVKLGKVATRLIRRSRHSMR